MTTLKLCLESVSPVFNFLEKRTNIFAIKNNIVYFINTKKLDKILSLLCLLGEFNEYISTKNTKNITIWLKNKKLLEKTLLEEISFSFAECYIKGTINKIFTFSDKNQNPDFTFYPLIKNTILNIIIFEHFQNNYYKINNYAKKIIEFLIQNNIDELKKYSLESFLNYLFETEKNTILQKIQKNYEFSIYCRSRNSHKKTFCIEEIICNDEKNYFECIKPNQKFHFEIKFKQNNLLFNNIEKFLQFAEYIINSNTDSETQFITKFRIPAKSDFQKPQKFTQKSLANLHLVSLNQILYLCLNKTNQKTLNKIFTTNSPTFASSYFQEKNEENFKHSNYIEFFKKNQG